MDWQVEGGTHHYEQNKKKKPASNKPRAFFLLDFLIFSLRPLLLLPQNGIQFTFKHRSCGFPQFLLTATIFILKSSLLESLVKMIRLLFSLIFAEMALIVIFVFKTPLRKLVILGLDRAKRGRGPIVIKTVCATLFVVMMSSIYNAMSIHNRWSQDGDVNPTDQILLANYLLESSLMGNFIKILVIYFSDSQFLFWTVKD